MQEKAKKYHGFQSGRCLSSRLRRLAGPQAPRLSGSQALRPPSSDFSLHIPCSQSQRCFGSVVPCASQECIGGNSNKNPHPSLLYFPLPSPFRHPLDYYISTRMFMYIYIPSSMVDQSIASASVIRSPALTYNFTEYN